MAHHSEEPLPEGFLDSLQETEPTTFDGKLGATGNFPEGKLTAVDAGEIRFTVGSSQGRVIMDFGTRITWVGMTTQQARDVAASLEKHAKEIIDNAQGKD